MPDPVIDEIREIRHRISASCDHDPAKLVAYLTRYQRQFRDRLIYDPLEHAAEQAVEADTESDLSEVQVCKPNTEVADA